MKYFLYTFLFTGFIINILNIFKYYSNVKNIDKFEKLVVKLKENILKDKNSSEINKILYEIFENYETYINSNINFSFYPNFSLNQNIIVTAHWIANFRRYAYNSCLIDKFSKETEYSFEKLIEYMQLTLDECHISKGKNRYAIRESYINFIPIFYFKNCFEFFVSQLPFKNKEISQVTNWWINFINIITVFSGIVTIVGFFLQFFIIKS